VRYEKPVNGSVQNTRKAVRNQRYAEAKGVGEVGFVEAENDPLLSNEDI
jgi:hypothetical protein